MVVIVTGYTLFVMKNMTSYSRLQSNVLVKFVDTRCIFRDVGAAAGQGTSKRVEGNGNL